MNWQIELALKVFGITVRDVETIVNRHEPSIIKIELLSPWVIDEEYPEEGANRVYLEYVRNKYYKFTFITSSLSLKYYIHFLSSGFSIGVIDLINLNEFDHKGFDLYSPNSIEQATEWIENSKSEISKRIKVLLKGNTSPKHRYSLLHSLARRYGLQHTE